MQLEDALYEVLEVSPRASHEVIKAAYRCLVQHHHPDKNAGAEAANERLARINHAYAILSDPVKRRLYDRSAGVDHDFVERRGAHAAARGPYGGPPASHQGARPFGFRPLD
jgi:curved DNA-binding protein CbpA